MSTSLVDGISSSPLHGALNLFSLFIILDLHLVSDLMFRTVET